MTIAYVKDVSSNTSKTSGTQLGIGIPGAGVAAGNRVFVAFAMDQAAGTVSCADSGGNTYVVMADRSRGSGTSGLRVVTLTAHLTTGLVSGGHITVTHPTAVARAMSAIELSGCSTATDSSALDGSAGGNDGVSPTSPTVTKSDGTAGERVWCGAVGLEQATTTVTQPGAWTGAIPSAATSGGGGASNIMISGGYRIATGDSSNTYNPTYGSVGDDWVALVHAIKGASAPKSLVAPSRTARNALLRR